jgi:hypothetical protein
VVDAAMATVADMCMQRLQGILAGTSQQAIAPMETIADMLTSILPGQLMPTIPEPHANTLPPVIATKAIAVDMRM